MAKWANAIILDGGSDLVRTRAGLSAGRVKMHAIKEYTAGDSYATVVTTNSCAVVDMAPGDYVQSGASNRVTTTAAKSSVSITANSGAEPDLHIAHVDSVSSEVLFVTDETSNQVLTSGNTCSIPSHTFTWQQPT
ncbi:MAG: hypothetical protein ACRCV9_19115 [Burkholderiaceae bacterium]